MSCRSPPGGPTVRGFESRAASQRALSDMETSVYRKIGWIRNKDGAIQSSALYSVSVRGLVSRSL